MIDDGVWSNHLLLKIPHVNVSCLVIFKVWRVFVCLGNFLFDTDAATTQGASDIFVVMKMILCR